MFAAIAHDGRLSLFRQLIEAGPQGETAGQLAKSAEIAANTASAQLLTLVNAQLIYSERQGREIRYFANYPSLSGLLKFLLKDCCGKRSDLCKQVLKDCS